MEFLDLGLANSNYGFVDKETNVELEISKLISKQEQERNNENLNYDEVDQEIARLIHNFEEEEKQRREQGKPSLISCASPLLSFLLEEKDEELEVINDRLGISQAMSREDLEAHNLQKEIDLQNEIDSQEEIVKSQATELELEKSNCLEQSSSRPIQKREKDRERTALSVKSACIPHT